jgi:hypothetical protein
MNLRFHKKWRYRTEPLSTSRGQLIPAKCAVADEVPASDTACEKRVVGPFEKPRNNDRLKNTVLNSKSTTQAWDRNQDERCCHG